ncbi:glycerol-3-phosphate acyltransferase [Oceanobacillus alkalisoli]|uniref:glycerol-3-phosphate acyltransferase n=1 Tax=Oceanobacillus alkalisoli TaxID=2925113 RepID=UPI001EE4AE45|nr:glycerol-3-phosphate acyltransferase [Oceanobacillus alkalisoli]MCG5103804.1 glycerol-3-phosphate acyltransferase [Oceanobacillus alkalisoli]
MVLNITLVVLLSYCMGSLIGAYYITKWMTGQDIRRLGSGNAGARNAGRELGKKGFLYTVFIDVAKVMIALSLTSLLFPENKIMLLVSAFFLLVGHIWPVHLGGRGGKGVVVYLASTLFLVPMAIVVLGIIAGIGYLLIRNFTVSGLIAMLSIPVTAWIMGEYCIGNGLFILLIIVLIPHLRTKAEASV